MGKERVACCEKIGLNKGAWTPGEDMRLIAYVQKHGHGNWRSLPKRAGLARCGKSCRLRWINYLRPGLKRGNITKEEEETIIKLHEVLGNKWSKIAACLPGRTDNEIKNVWNTHIKKRFELKESMLSGNKKEAPTSSQSVSCSDVGSMECDQENSSDEKSKFLIELEECLTSKELIGHSESTDCQISSPSVSCSAISKFKMEGKQESCHTEKNNILIELEQSLAFGDFEISVNDYQTLSSSAPSQMDVHAYTAEINGQPMFSSPSFSCSNPTTNTGFNIDECKQDSNILIELEESLASPKLFELSGSDCLVENNQPITSPSFSCSNCIANNKFDIKCEQDSSDEKNNFLIELDQCSASTGYELSGNAVQMGLDSIMDIPEVPIGLEIWSSLDEDGGGNGNNTTPRTLEESCNFRPISTIEENLRVVENKGWLGYLEKELELC